MLVKGSGMGTVGLIPATTLGGGGMVAAQGAAITLGANLNVDRALQDRQMAQPQGPVMAMRLANLPPAASASRPLQRALDRNDQMTLRGQLGLQYLNSGEIKGKLDHRAHRAVRPGSELLCSDSIALVSAYHNIRGLPRQIRKSQKSSMLGLLVSIAFSVSVPGETEDEDFTPQHTLPGKLD
jgi:hypothetical protein